MPWGYAAVAAAAAYSAYSGSEASKKAGDAGKLASERAFNTATGTTAEIRRDLSGYRDSGTSALQRLMYLTGVGDRNQFNRDEAAAKAGIKKPTWEDAANEHLASHIRTFGKGYTSDSDMGAKQSQTQTIFDQMMGAYNTKLAALPVPDNGQTPGGPNDQYGSLTKAFTLDDFNKDPGYNFKLEEGMKALTYGASSRGLAQSTPGLKDLMRFNSGLASTEYNAAFARDQATKGMTYNFLQSMAGMGENAAAGTGTATLGGSGNAISALLMGGQAQAGGIMGSASAQNNAVQGGLSNYMYQQRYDEMMKRMPVFSSSTSSTPQYNSGNAPS